MSLADRRYRVSASKVANAMQRSSTRKLGSVAVEVQQGEGSRASMSDSANPMWSRTEGLGDAFEVGEQYQQQQGDIVENNRQQQMREPINRQRSQTLLHFPLSRTENAANVTILLTRTQRVLIENSWKRVKKAAVEGGMGAKVFHNVLVAQPDMKLLFGLEKVPQGRLKYEGQFRRHAGLLNRTLEYVIKNVQYTDKLGQHFRALGKKHCQMNGGRAFPTNYWDTFLECILQSVLETDGSISGRYHRCREAALAWRNLVGLNVPSLMGLRGTTLRGAYNCAGIMPSLRETSGRPCPSLVYHSHGSLGSLEMIEGVQYQQFRHKISNCNRIGINQTQQIPIGNSKRMIDFSRGLMPLVLQQEVLRGVPKRVTRSELIIDDKCEEAFYTPMTSLRTDRIKPRECSSTRRRSPTRSCSPSPRIFSTVQLLLSSVSSEPFERTLSSSEFPNDGQNQPQARHSFSEIANGKERVAAFEASKRMLGMAQKKNQLQVAGGDCPGQPRRLSAI
uniref:GLOBIN domain-containing protein n=1 Tax=Globodera pallida TaxID=36090 RepID=A0A183CLY2_GLOPA